MSTPTEPLPPEPATGTLDTEPLVAVGALTTVAAAVVACLIAFGVPLSTGQQAGLLGVLAALAPIVTALLGRGRVYSPSSVARLVSAARRDSTQG